MRLDEKQVEDYCKRTNQMEKFAPRTQPKREYANISDLPVVRELKPTKFGNVPTWVNDILFQSKKEASYYVQLLMQERCGIVRNIVLQPVFLLQEAFTKNGKKIQKIDYIADFQFEEKAVRGNHWVERIVDTKGVLTKEFRIKQKLFEKRYPDKTIIIV